MTGISAEFFNQNLLSDKDQCTHRELCTGGSLLSTIASSSRCHQNRSLEQILQSVLSSFMNFLFPQPC